MKRHMKTKSQVNRKFIVLSVTSETTLRAFCMDLISYLKKLGWKVQIITSENKDIKELEDLLGIKIHNVKMNRNPSPLKDLIATFKIIRILSKTKPAIVVSATPKASLLTMFAA